MSINVIFSVETFHAFLQSSTLFLKIFFISFFCFENMFSIGLNSGEYCRQFSTRSNHCRRRIKLKSFHFNSSIQNNADKMTGNLKSCNKYLNALSYNGLAINILYYSFFIKYINSNLSILLALKKHQPLRYFVHQYFGY